MINNFITLIQFRCLIMKANKESFTLRVKDMSETNAIAEMIIVDINLIAKEDRFYIVDGNCFDIRVGYYKDDPVVCDYTSLISFDSEIWKESEVLNANKKVQKLIDRLSGRESES